MYGSVLYSLADGVEVAAGGEMSGVCFGVLVDALEADCEAVVRWRGRVNSGLSWASASAKAV